MLMNEKHYCDSCLETLSEFGEAQQHFQVLQHSMAEDKHVCMNCGEYASELEELGFEVSLEYDECEEIA